MNIPRKRNILQIRRLRLNVTFFTTVPSTQAGPGRKVKQEEEEISRNHVPRLFLRSVFNLLSTILYPTLSPHSIQAAARSVRLDGDVILQQSEVLHWQAEGAGSMVDIRSVCSCTCQSCNPFQQGRTDIGHHMS